MAMDGLGVDRHILGLKLIAKQVRYSIPMPSAITLANTVHVLRMGM
jgi:hypothetical protein